MELSLSLLPGSPWAASVLTPALPSATCNITTYAGCRMQGGGKPKPSFQTDDVLHVNSVLGVS